MRFLLLDEDIFLRIVLLMEAGRRRTRKYQNSETSGYITKRAALPTRSRWLHLYTRCSAVNVQLEKYAALGGDCMMLRVQSHYLRYGLDIALKSDRPTVRTASSPSVFVPSPRTATVTQAVESSLFNL